MSFKSDPRIVKGMQAQLKLRQQRLAAGAKQIGWKVGFGAPAAKEKLRIEAPLVGFLLDRAVLQSGAAISLKGWQKPVVEPEIAVYIGKDLAAGADRETAKAAIAALGPAIELADLDCPIEDVEAVLSRDIFQRHVVLGPRDETRAGARLDGLSGRVTRSGKDVPVPVNLEANIGELIEIVRHVANVVSHFGDTLRAGQFIICGSTTPLQLLEAADTGFEWTLDPIGEIAVRFTPDR